MGPTHPEEGDTEHLGQFISQMPGGEYIGDQWKREPMALVGVDINDHERGSDVLDMVMRAYPPRLIGEDVGPKWAASYLFHVPRTVAKILMHYPLALDEAEAGASTLELIELEELLGTADEAAISLLGRFWTPEQLSAYSLGDALERIEEVKEVAEETGKALAAVLEVTECLWKERSRFDFDGALRAAEAVLA